jgi:hypothetical protein
MLVNTWGSERSPACSGSDLSPLEMTEEFLPFLVGGGAVFIGRPQRPPASQERQVGLDRLFGIDGLVRDRDVDVPMTGDNLGDMRRQATHDRLRDK